MIENVKEKVKKNWLEWVVFTVSLILVTGTLAFLIWDGATKSEEPPFVVVELGPTIQESGRYIIPVTLRNEGGQAAKAVTVEVVLMSGGQELETAEIQVDYLPRSSTRKGRVVFTEDPASADKIQTHVLGYELP